MTRLLAAWTLIRDVLSEIFEENAYRRFLDSRALPNSREAYAEYLRDTSVTRERRPRCC